MDLLVDPFTADPDLARALAAGILAVIGTSVIGTWVVLRGMSFIGDAIAHGVIPGIALAVLFGFSLLLGAAISAVVMVLGISLVGRHSRLPEDTSIGLLFVGMLSLGVVIASAQGSEGEELTEILFGDALGVTGGDILTLALAAIVVIAVSAVAHRPFLALAFSRQKAKALGFHPGLAHQAMLVLVGLTVVVSFKTVGTLLVFALLIASPSAASLISRRVPVMMGVAVALGIVAVYVGLVASHHFEAPPSAMVALVSVLQFFVVMFASELRVARASRTPQTTAA